MHSNRTHTTSETLSLTRSSPTSSRPATSQNSSHGSPPPSLQIKFHPQPILSSGRSMFRSRRPKLPPIVLMSPTVYCPMATLTASTGLPTTLPTDHFLPAAGIKHGVLDFWLQRAESSPAHVLPRISHDAYDTARPEQLYSLLITAAATPPCSAIDALADQADPIATFKSDYSHTSPDSRKSGIRRLRTTDREPIFLFSKATTGLLVVAPRSFIHALTTLNDYSFIFSAPFSSSSLLGFPRGCFSWQLLCHQLSASPASLSSHLHYNLSNMAPSVPTDFTFPNDWPWQCIDCGRNVPITLVKSNKPGTPNRFAVHCSSFAVVSILHMSSLIPAPAHTPNST